MGGFYSNNANNEIIILSSDPNKNIVFHPQGFALLGAYYQNGPKSLNGY
jgi:hypothetical protein